MSNRGINNRSYVVAVGASAGGLQSFQGFFENATTHAGFAYVVIQHLSPDYQSHLAELLKKHTDRRIKVATQGMELEKETIYVIPPGRKAATDGVRLLLSVDEIGAKPSTLIDDFFSSLAAALGNRAVAVILSGTGSDGSKGIASVKTAGGFVFVQEPAEAKFNGMPISSVNTGLANAVAGIEELHELIVDHLAGAEEKHKKNGGRSALNELLTSLAARGSIDFTGYKRQTVERRIARRLDTLRLKSLREYSSYVSLHPEEADAFASDMMIGVTSFFRDLDAWVSLAKNVLGPIIEQKEEFGQLKAWVVACSTGEEAYSLAIALDGVMRKKNKRLEVKIFASDLSAQHIGRAGKGAFSRESLRHLDKTIVARYFVKEGNNFIITALIRKQIVFSKHNVLTDPPFINNDLVCCRNMLIYMDTEFQRKVFHRLDFSLRTNGYLFLGSSEGIPEELGHFTPVDKKHRIYLKRSETPKNERKIITTKFPAGSDQNKPRFTQGVAAAVKDLMEDSTFAAIRVNNNGVIEAAEGMYRRFIELPPGDFSRVLTDLLPPPFSFQIKKALEESFKSGRKCVFRDSNVFIKQKYYWVHVVCRPVAQPPGAIITINAIENPENSPLPSSEGEKFQVETLREELRKGEIYLNAVVEELESTNEELQSANEELMSSNEELQSGNEELQSVNEELHTLNYEHQQKIQELVDLNDDLQNYFRTSDIGQIILDQQLHVRRYNAAAATLVQVRDADIGRPFSHLRRKFSLNSLDESLSEVLNGGSSQNHETATSDGRSLIIKIHPFIRQDGTIGGTIITFIDITAVKRLSGLLNGVFEASRQSILVFENGNGVGAPTCLRANSFAIQLFGEDRVREGATLQQISPALLKTVGTDLQQMANTGSALNTEFFSDDKWFDVSGVRFEGGVALILTDISRIKRNEERLARSYEEMYAAKEKLRGLNRDLEKMVRDRTMQLSQSEERFRLLAAVTNDAIIDWHLVNDSIWISANFEEKFGYTAAEVQNRGQWLENVHPQDKEKINKETGKNINAGANAQTLEYRYKTKNGEYLVIAERSIILQDESGVTYRLLSSMLDISALRAAEKDLRDSEARLRLALDSTELAGWDLDLRTRKLIHSKNLPVIFGHSLNERLDREFLRRQILDDDLQLVDRRMKEALLSGEYSYEARIKWPDGSVHWIKTEGRIIFGDEHEPQRMLGITREITNEKNASIQLEELVTKRTAELNEANRKLRRTNKELAQYTFLASHDLQEPVRKIKTFVSLLRSHVNDRSSYERFLNKISVSADRISSLISGVKEFAKLSGEGEEKQEIDLQALLLALKDDFELKTSEKNIRLTFTPLPSVYGNLHQLNQLFYMVLDQFLDRSGPSSEISLSADTVSLTDRRIARLTAGNYYRIDVRHNNGTDVGSDRSDPLFDVLSEADTGNQDERDISFLLCRKIADNHDGAITFSPIQANASVLSVYLPIN